MKVKNTFRQRNILLGCFFVYTATYLCRTNLSPALADIASTFGLSGTQAGMIASCFAIPYALGQLYNGMLADRMNSPRIMFIGLTGSILTNFVFSMANTYFAMMGLWFLNGCFQSMIWTPMLRIISIEFEDKAKDNALFLLSFTLVLGYLLSWLLSGYMTGLFNWRVAFRTTGLSAGILMVISIVLIGKAGTSRVETIVTDRTWKENQISLLALVFRTDLWIFLIGGLVNGYVRDGIMIWGPRMISETQNVNLSGRVMTALIVPLLSIFGIRCGKGIFIIMKRNLHKSIMLLFSVAFFCSLLLSQLYEGRMVTMGILMGICSAMCYGANPLLTSIAPLRYECLNRTATAGGLVDAMIYAGSALTGVINGAIVDKAGWQTVILSWSVMDMLGIVLLGTVLAKKSRTTQRV